MTTKSRLWYALLLSGNLACGFTGMLRPTSMRSGAPNSRRPVVVMSQRQDRVSVSGARKRRGERKGYYIRPAVALERGGGFFIPGLEGWRLRVTIAATVLTQLALERTSGIQTDAPQLTSTVVAAVAALALLARTGYSLLGGGGGGESALPLSTGGDVRRRSYYVPSLEPQVYEDYAWTANTLVDVTNSKAVRMICAFSNSDMLRPHASAFEPTISRQFSWQQIASLHTLESSTPRALYSRYRQTPPPPKKAVGPRLQEC